MKSLVIKMIWICLSDHNTSICAFSFFFCSSLTFKSCRTFSRSTDLSLFFFSSTRFSILRTWLCHRALDPFTTRNPIPAMAATTSRNPAKIHMVFHWFVFANWSCQIGMLTCSHCWIVVTTLPMEPGTGTSVIAFFHKRTNRFSCLTYASVVSGGLGLRIGCERITRSLAHGYVLAPFDGNCPLLFFLFCVCAHCHY